jgi:hypothetical protein
MKPIRFAALLGLVAVVSMAHAQELNCSRVSYARAQTFLTRMSPSCGCGAPSCAAPSCRAPSCAAPSCAAPTCAARPSCTTRITCAAPTCAAPTCAAPTCAAPSCAAPTCAAPTCAAPSCASPIINRGCNTCGRSRCCCPRLIPALMSKIDCVLQRLYANPCNPVCGRPCRTRTSCAGVWDNYQSDCGCSSGGCSSCGAGENWVPSMSPTPMNVDPFQDDDLRAPPPVPTDARNSRKPGNTKLARLRIVKQEPTPAKPSTNHHSAVSIRLVDGEVQVGEQATSEVVPVSLHTTSVKAFPKNPLRDN